MNRTDASNFSQEFAERWSHWDSTETTDPHDARSNERRVKDAAFNQCLDFLPDEAITAVADRDEGSPVLLTLGGDRLYVLSVSNPGVGEGPATTECELHRIDATRSTVACRTKFYGQRVNETTLQRETTWRFQVGDFKAKFTTQVNPDADRNIDENFAQELAKTIGWKTLP